MGARGGDTDRWAGRTLENRYRLESRLALGGNGVVYRAEHLRIGGSLAIKMVEISGLDDAVVEQLETEARTVSLIGHDNIVRVLDFGRVDGAAYLAMELLEGETLAQRVERCGPLSLDETTAVMIQVAFALEAAHEQGIVHRDVKPENIFLCRQRQRSNFVKVLDFGLALVGTVEQPVALAGISLAGTPAFLAPETFQPGNSAVGPQSDLFSLAVTMFWALSGRLPFVGRDPIAVLASIAGDRPPRLSEVVPDLPLAPRVDSLLAQALEKEPARRIATAGELRLRLVELRTAASRPARRREDQLSPPEKRSLATWVSHQADGVIVELAGAIDAGADLDEINPRLASRPVELRLAGVDHLDAAGCRALRSWLATLTARDRSVRIHELSPLLVLLLAIDPELLAGCELVSVMVPFYCRPCGRRELKETAVVTVQLGAVEPQLCAECGWAMAVDVVEELYLRGVRGAAAASGAR